MSQNRDLEIDFRLQRHKRMMSGMANEATVRFRFFLACARIFAPSKSRFNDRTIENACKRYDCNQHEYWFFHWLHDFRKNVPFPLGNFKK